MVPKWHLIPYIIERWAEIEGVDNVFMVSFATSQRTSRITCRRTRLVFEGKAFLQARHSRFLTLLGTFKFQMVCQRGFEMSEVEERNLHFGYMVRSRYQLVEYYTVGFFSVVEASKSSKEFSRISLLQVRDS